MKQSEPIASLIPARLWELEAVREASQQLTSQGKGNIGDVEALALDKTAPIESRFDAITVLMAMERGRTDILRDLLGSNDPMIVIETLKSVRSTGTEWAIPELVSQLRSCGDPSKRAVCAWTLAAYPNNADVQSILLEVMTQDDDRSVREHAIEALSEFRSPPVLDALLCAMKQGSAGERFWALYSLGTLADPQASEAVAQYLDDQTVIPNYGTVAHEARWALDKITQQCRRVPEEFRRLIDATIKEAGTPKGK